MAGKNVSFSLQAKDEATGKINKLTGTINSFSKEVKNSLKPLDNFGKSLKSLGSMGLGLATIKGGFDAVAGSIKNVVSGMLQLESEFAQADAVIKRIDFAGTINKQLGATSKELKDFSEETSKALKNAISSDEINAEIATLAFDKTSDQIREIISVALDLSAAMGTNLSTAVQQLNQTFSGSIGQLGKYYPELKNITAEGLAAGDALTYLKGKVSGLAKEVSETSKGSIDGFNNSVANLKEAMGGLLTEYITPVRDALAGLMADFTNDLNKIEARIRDRKRIANGGATLEEAQQQYDLWIRARNDAEKQMNEAKNDVDYTRAANKYANAGQQALSYQLMMEEIKKQNKITEVTAADFISNSNIHWKTSSGSSAPASEKTQVSGTPSVLSSYDVDTSGWNSFFSGLKAKVAERSAEDFAEYVTKMNKAIESQNELRDIESEKILAKVQREEELKKAEEERIQGLKNSLTNSITGNTGELGRYANAFMENGPYGLLIEYAGQLFSMLSEESGIINTFFNSVTYFTKQFIEPLANLLEPIINPMLTIIQGLGETVGAILRMLQPFVDLVADVLNIVGGAIYWLEAFLTNIADTLEFIFVAIENGFIDVYNAINGWGKDLDKKSSNKSWDEIVDKFKFLFSSEFADYYQNKLDNNYLTLSPATSGSGSASYTAERDVYVNIYYNNSFVNGDARQIALAIEDELKSAHALGY